MNEATPIASPTELAENGRAIKQMAAFQEWKATVEGQMEGRTGMALTPIKHMEDALERNYANGEVAGMMAAIQMWDLLIDSWEVEAKRRADDDPEQPTTEEKD